jgi:hypothetical protein
MRNDFDDEVLLVTTHLCPPAFGIGCVVSSELPEDRSFRLLKESDDEFSNRFLGGLGGTANPKNYLTQPKHFARKQRRFGGLGLESKIAALYACR